MLSFLIKNINAFRRKKKKKKEDQLHEAEKITALYQSN